MEKNKDYESGCLVLVLFICMIISTCGACSYKNNLDKVKTENGKLKRDILYKEERISDLEKLNKSYEWQIEQVPYVIEHWCKGE